MLSWSLLMVSFFSLNMSFTVYSKRHYDYFSFIFFSQFLIVDIWFYMNIFNAVELFLCILF